MYISDYVIVEKDILRKLNMYRKIGLRLVDMHKFMASKSKDKLNGKWNRHLRSHIATPRWTTCAASLDTTSRIVFNQFRICSRLKQIQQFHYCSLHERLPTRILDATVKTFHRNHVRFSVRLRVFCFCLFLLSFYSSHLHHLAQITLHLRA